jgi:hypothetical protein
LQLAKDHYIISNAFAFPIAKICKTLKSKQSFIYNKKTIALQTAMVSKNFLL